MDTDKEISTAVGDINDDHFQNCSPNVGVIYPTSFGGKTPSCTSGNSMEFRYISVSIAHICNDYRQSFDK